MEPIIWFTVLVAPVILENQNMGAGRPVLVGAMLAASGIATIASS
jgi:hypothetical protein